MRDPQNMGLIHGRCRHERAREFENAGRLIPADAEPSVWVWEVDRWCPTCGAIYARSLASPNGPWRWRYPRG